MNYCEQVQQYIEQGSELIATIEIDEVYYTVNAYGSIGISIKTNSKEYEKYLFDIHKHNIKTEQFVGSHTICPGQIYQVSILERPIDNIRYVEEYWVLVKDSELSRRCIRLDRELEQCPGCNEYLIKEESGIYCINSSCPAKVQSTIKKYMINSGMEIDWNIDFKIIHDLISLKHIRDLSDLYQLTTNQITSLGYPVRLAHDLIDRIEDTIGKIKISSFLQSLNLDPTYNNRTFSFNNTKQSDQFWIDNKLIDDSFADIDAFIDWCEFAYTRSHEEDNLYVSEPALLALYNYFSCRSNLAVISQLKEYGVFVSETV